MRTDAYPKRGCAESLYWDYRHTLFMQHCINQALHTRLPYKTPNGINSANAFFNEVLVNKALKREEEWAKRMNKGKMFLHFWGCMAAVWYFLFNFATFFQFPHKSPKFVHATLYFLFYNFRFRFRPVRFCPARSASSSCIRMVAPQYRRPAWRLPGACDLCRLCLGPLGSVGRCGGVGCQPEDMAHASQYVEQRQPYGRGG